MAMTNRLLNLPTEILLLIFYCLATPVDLVSIQLVCRYLRNIVQESDTLRYIFELGLAGLEDTETWPPNTPISEKLDALRRRQKAWTELEWQSTAVIDRSASVELADMDDWFINLEAGCITVKYDDLSIISTPISSLPATNPSWSKVTQKGPISATRATTVSDLLAIVTVFVLLHLISAPL